MPNKKYNVSEKRMKFYNSSKWRKFRKLYVIKCRGLCEEPNCGKAGKELHHKKPLNDYNLDDIAISLNEEEVEFLCTEHHNSRRSSAYVREGFGFDDDGNLRPNSKER